MAEANPNSAIADFPQEPEVLSPDLSVISHQSSANNLSSDGVDKPDNFTEALQLVEAIARHFATPYDPLEHYTALEGAIASGWILSTAEA